MWFTGDRMPLKEICVLVPSLNYIIEWFIFHEQYNLNQGSRLPSSFIPSSVAHFSSSLPISSISPPARPGQTHRRVHTHTPLILLTPMALRKEVQYIHQHQNRVITILQNDNHREPRGIQRLFCFVFCSLECFSLVFKSRGDCSLLCLRGANELALNKQLWQSHGEEQAERGRILCPISQPPAEHDLPFTTSYSAAFHVCDCVDKEKVAISGSIS